MTSISLARGHAGFRQKNKPNSVDLRVFPARSHAAAGALSKFRDAREARRRSLTSARNESMPAPASAIAMRTRAAARLSEAPRSPLADERRARIATTTSWSSAPIVDELIQDGKRIAEDEQKAQAALRQIQQQLEQQLEAREARVTAYFNRKRSRAASRCSSPRL